MTLGALKGKARLLAKPFTAGVADRALLAAAGYGKYWDYITALNNIKMRPGRPILLRVADSLGMPKDAFEKLLADTSIMQNLASFRKEGERVGVTMTPTFFLGGNVNPDSVPVPPGVVTLADPVVPVPTTAVIWVAELTVKLVAAVPPKLTALALVKPVPVIVTEVPVPAVVGVNEVIVGAVAEYVNPASVPVPPGVVTLTEPVVPVPTTAVICVAEFTVKLVAALPPKLTALALVKPVPVIVTEVPVPAVVG